MAQFTKQFTELIKRNNFQSDEQLALRAMTLQKSGERRINVQARTINNWRNGRSKPRKPNDRQLQLVLSALDASQDDIEKLKLSLDSTSTTQADVSDRRPRIGQSNLKISKLAAALLFIAATTLIIMKIPAVGHNESYIGQIPPTQLRLSPEGFVLPNSDQFVISETELEPLTGWELYVARNEIFARHGRPFVKPQSICLQNHFDRWAKQADNATGWYTKRSGDRLIGDLEYRNAETIRNYECNVRGGQYNCNRKLNACQ